MMRFVEHRIGDQRIVIDVDHPAPVRSLVEGHDAVDMALDEMQHVAADLMPVEGRRRPHAAQVRRHLGNRGQRLHRIAVRPNDRRIRIGLEQRFKPRVVKAF